MGYNNNMGNPYSRMDKEYRENDEYRGNNKYRENDEYKESNRYKENNECGKDIYTGQNHNHEFLSSTDYDGEIEHNHRIAGVTSPPIPYGKSHVHKVDVYTDTFGNHFHKICDTTGPALYLPGGKHIHLLKGETTCDAGHDHIYYFATLIEDPSNVPEDKKC